MRAFLPYWAPRGKGMSGRRPVVKGWLRLCERFGCGHVFGLLARVTNVPHDVGYLNPRLYREIGPAKVLRTITEGNNGVKGVPGFQAGPSWSAVAGWGSPNGSALLAWLRAHPN